MIFAEALIFGLIVLPVKNMIIIGFLKWIINLALPYDGADAIISYFIIRFSLQVSLLRVEVLKYCGFSKRVLFLIVHLYIYINLI